MSRRFGLRVVLSRCVTALDESTAAAGDSSPTTQLNGNANSNANSNDNSLNNQDASPQNAVAPTKRVEELYDIPVGEYRSGRFPTQCARLDYHY